MSVPALEFLTKVSFLDFFNWFDEDDDKDGLTTEDDEMEAHVSVRVGLLL